MRRGFTLIEMMIAVALIGIFVALVDQLKMPLHRNAAALLLRERARQVLEYEADAITHHAAIDDRVLQELMADLPDAHLFETPRSKATALSVSWRSSDGEGQYLELVVLGGAR